MTSRETSVRPSLGGSTLRVCGGQLNDLWLVYSLVWKPHTFPRPTAACRGCWHTLRPQPGGLGVARPGKPQGGRVHLLGRRGSGLPVALRGAPRPRECGAWQPPGGSDCVRPEPPLRQPQRCSKRPGLHRLRRRQKDKSNPVPSLTHAGSRFQEPQTAESACLSLHQQGLK